MRCCLVGCVVAAAGGQFHHFALGNLVLHPFNIVRCVLTALKALPDPGLLRIWVEPSELHALAVDVGESILHVFVEEHVFLHFPHVLRHTVPGPIRRAGRSTSYQAPGCVGGGSSRDDAGQLERMRGCEDAREQGARAVRRSGSRGRRRRRSAARPPSSARAGRVRRADRRTSNTVSGTVRRGTPNRLDRSAPLASYRQTGVRTDLPEFTHVRSAPPALAPSTAAP